MNVELNGLKFPQFLHLVNVLYKLVFFCLCCKTQLYISVFCDILRVIYHRIHTMYLFYGANLLLIFVPSPLF